MTKEIGSPQYVFDKLWQNMQDDYEKWTKDLIGKTISGKMFSELDRASNWKQYEVLVEKTRTNANGDLIVFDKNGIMYHVYGNTKLV